MSAHDSTFDHAVIGAGPGGITAVACLLDAGVDSVAWVDPDFAVGRLGARYRQVPSNTRAKLFQDYVQALPVVRDSLGSPVLAPAWERLAAMEAGDRGPLATMCDVMQGITSMLRERVTPHASRVTGLEHRDGAWNITLDDGTGLRARSVVLATGSVPACLPLDGHPSEQVALDEALDPARLAERVSPDDRVAVLGNSHSAVLVLKNLLELPQPPSGVVHLFRRPLIYAEYLDGWIRHDDTGLKGAAADWAHEHLERHPHPSIRPVRLTPGDGDALTVALAGCTRVIQAVGFVRDRLPSIRRAGSELDSNAIGYDDRCGQLLAPDGSELPGLFGFGIAFPQGEHDREGRFERRVGVWKFLRYAREVCAPMWMEFSRR